MNRIAEGILKYAKWILGIFAVLCVLGIGGTLSTPINYNLASYIPDEAPSTQAIEKMGEQFTTDTPNARLYIPNLTLAQALDKKAEIASVDSVSAVIWLDDVADLERPLNTLDQSLVESYYKDNGALFQITVDTSNAAEAVEQLHEIGGDGSALEGHLVDLANAQIKTQSEVGKIIAIIIPIALILLCFPTRSWLEPLILFVAIAAAVVINMGTNFFLGEISFITSSVSGILQLAVSMDYGIFLLHARDEATDRGMDRQEALKYAIVKSSNAIVASSLTTLLGFLALVFMSFKLGPDLGIVLAKGIVFSLISVLVFMPALLKVCDRGVQKTTHRKLMPSFNRLGKFVSKGALWLLLILILVPLAFIAQGKTDFIYGTSEYEPGSKQAIDQEFIQDNFGSSIPMVMMVPRDNPGAERQMLAEIDEIPEVTSIISYQTMAGPAVPVQIAPSDQVSQLLSKDYSRSVIMVKSEYEGDHAFRLVEEFRAIGQKYFPDKYYLTGQNVVTYDMKESIQSDNIVVNGLAIFSVWLVLVFSFRSISIPFILVFTIESAIWINMSFPYFSGTSLSYIGYLIISSVQLGATVDYAILYTQHYISNRQHIASKREAIRRTTTETFGTLITPAAILTLAGLILWAISSMKMISEIGAVLGRGAFISFMMVNFVLPGLLIVFDRLIGKTTWKANFVRSTR